MKGSVTMPLRPIEQLSIASKSWEASTQDVARHNKEVSTQNQLANQFTHEVQHNSEQTIKSSKSDTEYRLDSNEAGDGKGYSGNKGKKKKKSAKGKDNSLTLGTIDIRI